MTEWDLLGLEPIAEFAPSLTRGDSSGGSGGGAVGGGHVFRRGIIRGIRR